MAAVADAAGVSRATVHRHFRTRADLLAALVKGARVTLCTQCAQRRGIGPEDVIDGIRIAGAATFVSEVTTNDVQALVY